LTKIQKFQEELDKVSQTDNNEELLSLKLNVDKIIKIIKIFIGVKIQVLFEARSLIFKDFDQLLTDIQDTIVTGKKFNKEYT